MIGGTLVATPGGQVPVEQLQPGMLVWTLDAGSKRVAEPVLKSASTPVPQPFAVLKITLEDGRAVSASPGHPTAELRPLSEYRVGDSLDGSKIAAIETLNYLGGATFDLLPAGPTGLYWANGILLASTLK